MKIEHCFVSLEDVDWPSARASEYSSQYLRNEDASVEDCGLYGIKTLGLEIESGEHLNGVYGSILEAFIPIAGQEFRDCRITESSCIHSSYHREWCKTSD